MKKKEIKVALDRIRPREALVNLTVARIEEYKTRRDTRQSSRKVPFNTRLAGAICAFAFVFSLGFMLAGQNINLSNTRMISDLATVEASTDNFTQTVPDHANENGYIIINGSIEAISFTDLTDTEREGGAVRHCKVRVNAIGLVKYSEDLDVDLNKKSTVFEADIVFYDNEIMNNFFDQSMSDMILCIIPDSSEGWNIVKFAQFKK